MSHYLDNLATPATEFYEPADAAVIANEVQGLALAARQKVNEMRTANKPGLEASIVGFSDFADRLQQRADAFRVRGEEGGF